MLTHKSIRSRGKVSLTKYFQKFKQGDKVALVKDLAVQSSGFPDRMQGRTGVVVSARGGSYVVAVKDFAREKQYIVKPVHLRRIRHD